MTRTIQNYIMAIILAGAMILALGMTLQTAYAEDETAAGETAVEYEADFGIDGMATTGCVLPGCEYHASAILIQDGQILDKLPEGATVEWQYGVMEAETRPADFTIVAEGNGERAAIHFPELPEDVDYWTGWICVKISVDGKTIESNTNQIGIQNDFYEVITPYIDPFMWEGDVTDDQRLGVVRHFIDEEGNPAQAPCSFSYTWKGDDIFDTLDVIVDGSKGMCPVTIQRLKTDAELDFELVIRYTDAQGNKETASMNFWLAEFTTNLTDCSTEITNGDFFTVYDDNWAFVDDVDADPAKSVSQENIQIISGELEQAFDPDSFEVTDVKKYVGYEEETGDDIWEDASFPLTFDKKGTKDKNGFRTDGTSLYKFAVQAKDGSRWTGKTSTMYLFVNSKYSLYNLKDYFIGSVEFTKLNKYLKSWDKDPYERYVVPKGKIANTIQPKIMIGDYELTPGKQVTVTYKNDKTGDTFMTFPANYPGEYTVIITGNSPYFGMDNTTHLKIYDKNPLSVKGKTVKIKEKQIKKKAKALGVSKVIKTVKKGQGKVTYKKLSGNKKITVAKTGKVTVKKGLKKGTYKVKVSVKAAGNDKYNPITKKVTFTIKVTK